MKFFRIFGTYFFILISISLLVGRNHLLLGTGLIVLRWVLIGVGIILSYILYKRNRSNRLTLVVITLVFLLFGEFVYNELNQESLVAFEPTTELSLMSYNLFFKNGSKDAAVSIIKKFNPDILLVQELTPEWYNHLQNALGSNYKYSMCQSLKGTHGIGVFSVYPLSEEKLLLNSSNLPYAQFIEAMVKGKSVQICNTHLASPAVAVENEDRFLPLLLQNYQVRDQQVSAINSICNQKREDANLQVLIGDLNTTQYEPLYRKIKSNWVDLYLESGNGTRRNFPNSAKTPPLFALDYILLRGAAKGSRFEVINGGSSDHLAIFGKIEL